MILNWLMSNMGTALEVLLLLGGWLIFIGRTMNKLDDMKKQITDIGEWQEQHEEKLNVHLQSNAPHSTCLVEVSRTADMTASMNEMRQSIRRVENWVIALASKAGIKEPKNGE